MRAVKSSARRAVSFTCEGYTGLVSAESDTPLQFRSQRLGRQKWPSSIGGDVRDARRCSPRLSPLWGQPSALQMRERGLADGLPVIEDTTRVTPYFSLPACWAVTKRQMPGAEGARFSDTPVPDAPKRFALMIQESEPHRHCM